MVTWIQTVLSHTPHSHHLEHSFLGCEVDVTGEHGRYAGNLLLAIHELFAGVGFEVIRHFPGHARHHAQKVHALPVVTQHIHQCLNEPRAACRVAPRKVTCQRHEQCKPFINFDSCSNHQKFQSRHTDVRTKQCLGTPLGKLRLTITFISAIETKNIHGVSVITALLCQSTAHCNWSPSKSTALPRKKCL